MQQFLGWGMRNNVFIHHKQTLLLKEWLQDIKGLSFAFKKSIIRGLKVPIFLHIYVVYIEFRWVSTYPKTVIHIVIVYLEKSLNVWFCGCASFEIIIMLCFIINRNTYVRCTLKKYINYVVWWVGTYEVKGSDNIEGEIVKFVKNLDLYD